jgi:MFS family permease
MVDMAMLARPAMALLNAATFLIGYAMFAVFTILPGFLGADPDRTGYGFGASPIATGMFFVPLALAMLVSGPLAGGARRLSPLAVLRLGIVTLVAGLLLMTVLVREAWMVCAWMGLIGAGCGTCLAVLGRLVVEAVPADQSGIAGGMNTIARQIGGAVAAQAGAAIVTGAALADGVPPASAYRAAFLVGAACAAVALVVTLGVGLAGAAPAVSQPLLPRQASEPPSIT